MDKHSLRLLVLLVFTVSLGVNFLFFTHAKTSESISFAPAPIAAVAVAASSTVPAEPIFDPANLTWREVKNIPWAGRDSHAAFVFKNRMWVMGGLDGRPGVVGTEVDYSKAIYFNDIWSSEDGENWKLETAHASWGPRRSMSVIEQDGKLFMLGGWTRDGGYDNKIWSSTDGVNWMIEKENGGFVPREGQKIVEFGGKFLMIGGVNYDDGKTFNDVWESEDAVNWKLVAELSAWAPRWDHDVAANNGKLYLAGGMNGAKDKGGKNFDDVWTSENGKDWTKAGDDLPWGRRQGLGLVEYKNLMWLVSGMQETESESVSDTWFSADGMNWQKTKNDAGWSAVEDHSVLVFKNKLWLLGGMSVDRVWNNDVWQSSL